MEFTISFQIRAGVPRPFHTCIVHPGKFCSFQFLFSLILFVRFFGINNIWIQSICLCSLVSAADHTCVCVCVGLAHEHQRRRKKEVVLPIVESESKVKCKTRKNCHVQCAKQSEWERKNRKSQKLCAAANSREDSARIKRCMRYASERGRRCVQICVGNACAPLRAISTKWIRATCFRATKLIKCFSHNSQNCALLISLLCFSFQFFRVGFAISSILCCLCRNGSAPCKTATQQLIVVNVFFSFICAPTLWLAGWLGWRSSHRFAANELTARCLRQMSARMGMWNNWKTRLNAFAAEQRKRAPKIKMHPIEKKEK